MHRWKEFYNYLQEKYGEISYAERGFAPDEIERIKIVQGVDYLPPIYVTFLRDFGKVLHELSGVRHHKESALYFYGIITQFGLPELPSDAFYFYSDLDIVFLYFQTASHDPNPPIFEVGEDNYQAAHKQSYDSLISFLIYRFGFTDRFK